MWLFCNGEICDGIANNNFDIGKLKLFFNNFTNQDSKGFKHFQWDRKFIMLIRKKGIVDEQWSILIEGLYE